MVHRYFGHSSSKRAGDCKIHCGQCSTSNRSYYACQPDHVQSSQLKLVHDLVFGKALGWVVGNELAVHHREASSATVAEPLHEQQVAFFCTALPVVYCHRRCAAWPASKSRTQTCGPACPH